MGMYGVIKHHTFSFLLYIAHSFCYYVYMRNSKTKLADVVDEIIELRQRIKTDTERLKSLESISLPDTTTTPEPNGFDYKEAIMEFFNEKPNSVVNLATILQYISTKHNFTPDRSTASIRIGYLADTAKKLERPKRGFYRLATKTETTPSSEQGSG